MILILVITHVYCCLSVVQAGGSDFFLDSVHASNRALNNYVVVMELVDSPSLAGGDGVLDIFSLSIAEKPSFIHPSSTSIKHKAS